MNEREWTAMITVGRVVRPHGNRGHVVVAPETDFGPERFGPGARLYTWRGGAVEALHVAASREHDARWIVGFEGAVTIPDAEALRGLELRIPALELRPLGPGAFYAHELVGARVETGTGEPVGTVDRVELGAGTPLLVVAGPGGERLVPLAAAICRRVDVAAGVIVIDPPEGLLELNERGSAGGDRDD
jgi:16S rRNA processing protein RimM